VVGLSTVVFASSLLGLVGDVGGNILYLANIDPTSGHYQLVNDLSQYGGGLGILLADWKNSNLYFATINMKNLLNTLYKTDLSGNIVVNFTSKTIIDTMVWDEVSDSFYGASVDPVAREYDIAEWDLSAKTVTPKFHFNSNTQTEDVGLAFYIQHNHTMVQYTGDMSSSHFALTFIDTQTWKSQVVPLNEMIFAWAFDEPSNTLYFGSVNKGGQAQIKSYVLGSKGPTMILTFTTLNAGFGAASYDSTTNLFYISLSDGSNDGYIASVNVLTKKATVVATIFNSYCFVTVPNSVRNLIE
jgi:hypothetical protein